MKLRSLRVHGFKSFADPTEVHFHDGITTIVGPNGCGKSNISDAIRWVLGEQRPTAIRGAKMEEAIFQGSMHRRPVNRGSVTMTVSNEDGALPVPFEEVEIGRTVYRDGGSDYSINRSGVRLKDVIDLTRDTGLGANAYAIIENRMIDAILSDRAEERRGLFEEAAGIGKYKDRRKGALRRLEQAEMDLQRLEDVIAEVASKVRSLARQRGKAERHIALRARRLDVEVAVVRTQLATLGERRVEVERALEGDMIEGEGMVAEVRTAEAAYETHRLRQVEAQQERSAAAGRLEEIRGDLGRWERDLAVAEERVAYARRRSAQIEEEQGDVHGQVDELSHLKGELETDTGLVAKELNAIEEQLGGRRAATDAVRARLVEARESLEGLESRERDVARRGAQLEGDAEASEAQGAELGRRLGRLTEELEEAADALTDLDSQGDLFSDRVEVLQTTVDEARAALSDGERAVQAAVEALEAARAAEVEAADRAQKLASRRSALEALERDGEGMEPAVRSVMDSDVEGVHGALSDFVRAEPGLERAVEAYLGPLAQGLVVADAAAARRVQRWFTEEWAKGGGLILLPLDAVRAEGGSGSLLAAVDPIGVGAPWVEALLGGADLVDEADLLDGSAPRVTRDGAARDARGVVLIGRPTGAGGLLERKGELERLVQDAGSASEAAREALELREALRRALRESEASLDERRLALRAAEDTAREATAEVAAAVDRRARIDRHRDELARQVEGTRASGVRAQERTHQAREDRQALAADEERLRVERTDARERVERVQEEWEAARGEQARLEVDLTRLQGERSRLSERTQSVRDSLDAAERRIEALAGEASGLQGEMEAAAELRTRGAEATEDLFTQREVAQGELRTKDEALSAVAEALAAAEGKARSARQAEREASDRRHRFELERQELDGRIGRIQDRLEGEWGRTIDDLLRDAQSVEGDPEALQEELVSIVAGLDRIGPVNMLAVEEHGEESQRLEFLQEQHADLIAARDDLRSAIRQINQTATELFEGTFGQIREHFSKVHSRLFEGGEADIWLADEEDPLESPIEIHASPSGKKTQRIDLLSGGERALTALALLFAIYLVKPSPFCVLDEVDAPLDENNIGRFIRLLQEFKSESQFVVITHNPRTIEAADWIYGVTMEEPGVSTVVGVRLEDALEQARGAA